jgi:hypothetical protein
MCRANGTLRQHSQILGEREPPGASQPKQIERPRASTRGLDFGLTRISANFQKRAGGAKGNRTPDLFIANEALYQLSYSPKLGKRSVALDSVVRQLCSSQPLFHSAPSRSRS